VQISAAKALRDRAEREARSAGDARVSAALMRRLLGTKEPA
jgi:3,8-divinyl chlorophyllide a/chlorophyllide a reductase subunit Z